MQPKTYRAKTIKDAIALVKGDLGADAMILNTRKLPIEYERPVGITGSLFEVTAVPVQRTGQSEIFPTEKSYLSGSIKSELISIKEMLYLLNKSGSIWERVKMNPEVIKLYGMLVKKGIDESFVQEFLEKSGVFKSRCNTLDNLRQKTFKEILKVIKTCNPFKTDNKKQVVASFLGPTGVGKTTTIAKLAANLCLQQKKRVGLVSIDSYRIAAMEQLKTYARILGIPCLPAFNKKDMQFALSRLREKDVILIDTAGRSHYDANHINELITLLGGDIPVERHLVLSITTNETEIKAAAEKFGRLGFQSYVFTKVDEAKYRGTIVNQIMRMKIPISFVTNGQRVPEDIAVASKIGILRLLFDTK
jgi:flagellar biosynthesis protein FlhF